MGQELDQYIKQINNWRLMFLQKPLDISNHEDRQTILREIESDLEPENLYCDGEISQKEARAKRIWLEACLDQLRMTVI